ncbi:Hypothetical predicted protein [Cloeon dipterum]|uniref:Sulfotransferase domain-containing protein n=1 Tax=Cloeon dipterum TaxID=197152 RepID=A0A8S1BYS4_9INSE|nr:Hypothetical predicted protein [Cloeon dipterum]
MFRFPRNFHRITLSQFYTYLIFGAILLALYAVIPNRSRTFASGGQERTHLRPSAERHGSFVAGNDTLWMSKISDAFRRLPDALIVGVKEGGTRELIALLKMHSEIVSPSEKLNFFDDDENYSRGIDWYRSQMPLVRMDQVAVEEAPLYFSSEKAVKRIYSVMPKAKIILVVQDPIKRLILDYENQKLVRAMLALEEAITYQTKDGLILVKSDEPIVRLSQYDDDFLKFTRYFSADRILILSGDRLMHKPWLEMERVQTFLGVGLEIRQEHFVYDKDSRDVCLRSPLTGPCIREQSVKTSIRQDIRGLLKEYFSVRVRRFQLLSGVDFFDEWLRFELGSETEI